jgi:hypothetical protein
VKNVRERSPGVSAASRAARRMVAGTAAAYTPMLTWLSCWVTEATISSRP